jgi:hypothetical protein
MVRSQKEAISLLKSYESLLIKALSIVNDGLTEGQIIDTQSVGLSFDGENAVLTQQIGDRSLGIDPIRDEFPAKLLFMSKRQLAEWRKKHGPLDE